MIDNGQVRDQGMRLSRRLILGVAFPVALALLAVNAAATYLNIVTIGTDSRQSTRSRNIVAVARTTLGSLRDAETSERGFLLTGDEVYLETYRSAHRALPDQLERLRSLTARDPTQAGRAAELRELVRLKLDELARSIALFREGRPDAALERVRTGRGREIMDRARRAVAGMEAEEQVRLVRRNESIQIAFRRTVETFLIATLLGLALLGIAVVSRRRELAERESRAEAIRRSEAWLSTTILSIGDAVIAIDDHTRVQLMNPVAEALTGYTLDEARGKPVHAILELVNEDTGQPAENPVARVMREGTVTGPHSHIVLVARDGKTTPIDDSAAPIKDAGGDVIGVILVFRDVTGRRRDEAERERLLVAERSARADAEEANRAKDQFLAVLSHELRTPLNPIMLAVTSMLERPAAAGEIRPTLQMIRENVALESRLIDDLLDVMRIARGKMPLQRAVTDCHALLTHALQICHADLQGKGLTLSLELSAREHHAMADAARLEQVFWNLVKNAVKFTPQGGSLAVRTHNEADRNGGNDLLVIEFADTGIGIDGDVLPVIFDPFQQGEGSITRRYGGMGLGLAIGRGVVEAHGGRLEAESDGPGLGATFRVRLKTEAKHEDIPASLSPPSPPPAPREATAAGLRVLLVEDDPETLRLMARLLRALGHDVTSAATLGDALRAADCAEFDLVVSDIGLPDGSGLDLARHVSARGPTPAIALTGYGMEEDIRRSHEAGFATHLTKPIDFNRLKGAIRAVALGEVNRS